MSEGDNRSQQSAAVLLQDELEEYCYSDSLSERGLREMFQRHGLTPNKNRLSDYFDVFFDACDNERVNEGIIRCLLEYFPDAAKATDVDGWSPLHFACGNKNVTLGIIQLLIDAAPDSVRSVSNEGAMPLHFLCENEKVDEATALEILKLLIEKYPESVRHANNDGGLPIHLAAGWRSLEFCRVLIEAYPESVSRRDNGGWTPLHYLCDSSKDDDDKGTAVQMLKLMIEKDPEAARHENNIGYLPIHYTSGRSSLEFFHVLVEANPESVSVPDASGKLPLHQVCFNGSLATVKYLYRTYPDAIDHTTTRGSYPMHKAIFSTKQREKAAVAVEIVQFLLDCDPDQKLIQCRGKSLLQYACGREYKDSNIETGIQIIRILFDAHPEAIENDRIALAANINCYHNQVKEFINGELVHARQAKDLYLMHTSDVNGHLPLHKALQNNVRLGSIKLLVKGNPSALRTLENNFALPLHIACQHHDSVSVVQYLLSLDATVLDTVDRDGSTVLHYACRGAKHETISMLLEKYDAASVSKRNAHGKLPINMLWESNAVEDRESVGYVGSVFQLVRAYPEMIQSAI